MYPTPRCHDSKKPSKAEFDRKSPCLSAVVWKNNGMKKGFLLNPEWVEYYLMCVPGGWSDIELRLPEECFIMWKDFSIEKIFNNKTGWLKEIYPQETLVKENISNRLKCIGNAQVSVVAAYAFKTLLKELENYEDYYYK